VTQDAIQGVTGPNIVFQGCNLQIKSRDWEGDTSATGNLIVGWDDAPYGGTPSQYRTGSNNLIVGHGNNFTSYGCFLAGADNTASASYSSVSGGGYNTASASLASVSGGGSNVASGIYASVCGGALNTASNDGASVLGGRNNTASGGKSTVSGGAYNTASGGAASISGGGGWTAGSGFTVATDLGWGAGNPIVNGYPKFSAP
jgi:hypothetical protein